MSALRGSLSDEYPYDVLVIVDFEATCDHGEKPIITQETQEIIEFPWVVLDLNSNTVIDKQQYYVKPEWNPALTEFCTELTGITTETLADKEDLRTVMGHFDDYVRENFTSRGKRFCVAADGSWDFKVAIRHECQKKNIPLPDYFSKFFDVQTMWSKCYDRPRRSLKGMLNLLDLDFHGRHHSGIADCLTVASIVQMLLRHGYVPREPEVIPADYDVTQDPLFWDFNFRDTETTVLKLRGFAWKTTVLELEYFLKPLEPVKDGITIIRDEEGQSSGVAFVEFKTAEDAEKAIVEKNRQLVGTKRKNPRYVNIFRTSKAVRDKVVADSEAAQKAFNMWDELARSKVALSNVVLLRRLPEKVNPRKIKGVFQTHPLKDEDIHIIKTSKGRVMREALVRFETLDLAEQALGQHWRYLSMQQIDILNTHRKFTAQYEGTPPDPAERKEDDARSRGRRAMKLGAWRANREQSGETVAGDEQNNETVTGVEQSKETATSVDESNGSAGGVEQGNDTTACVEQNGETSGTDVAGKPKPSSDVEALAAPAISAASSVAG